MASQPPQWVLLGICAVLTRRGSVQPANPPIKPPPHCLVLKTLFYSQTFGTQTLATLCSVFNVVCFMLNTMGRLT